MENIQRSVKNFAISGMFGTMMLLGTILNQAAHDDKPPVVHGKNEKNVSMMLFRTKHTKSFLAYVMRKTAQ
jgi:hypothetical protein